MLPSEKNWVTRAHERNESGFDWGFLDIARFFIGLLINNRGSIPTILKWAAILAGLALLVLGIWVYGIWLRTVAIVFLVPIILVGLSMGGAFWIATQIVPEATPNKRWLVQLLLFTVFAFSSNAVFGLGTWPWIKSELARHEAWLASTRQKSPQQTGSTQSPPAEAMLQAPDKIESTNRMLVSDISAALRMGGVSGLIAFSADCWVRVSHSKDQYTAIYYCFHLQYITQKFMDENKTRKSNFGDLIKKAEAELLKLNVTLPSKADIIVLNWITSAEELYTQIKADRKLRNRSR